MRAALEYLEDEAVFVRRGKGGRRFERAGGLVAAAYRHRMSRALDPQLHTHVVAREPRARSGRALDGAASPVAVHARADRRLPVRGAPARRGARAARARVGTGAQGDRRARRRRAGGARGVQPPARGDARGRGGPGLGVEHGHQAAGGGDRDRDARSQAVRDRDRLLARGGPRPRRRARPRPARGRQRSSAPAAAPSSAGWCASAVDERALGDLLAGAHGLTERSNTFTRARRAARPGERAPPGRPRGRGARARRHGSSSAPTCSRRRQAS